VVYDDINFLNEYLKGGGNMITTKKRTDKNGNSIVRITRKGFRGFSIQTNGNLPLTHGGHKINRQEISEYLKKHGTDHQKYLWFG